MKLSQVRIIKTDKIQTVEQLTDSPEYTFDFMHLLIALEQDVDEIVDYGAYFLVILAH